MNGAAENWELRLRPTDSVQGYSGIASPQQGSGRGYQEQQLEEPPWPPTRPPRPIKQLP
ncbi:MAG: hypothetical protein ACYS3N_13980 [Planctomycetota bacterium]